MIALYDRDPIELTQRFVDALEEVMLAEMEMMRNREPELADCWTWGRCGVQDLAMGQVDFEFGGDEDRPESLPDGEFVIVEIEDESEIAGIINGLTN